MLTIYYLFLILVILYLYILDQHQEKFQKQLKLIKPNLLIKSKSELFKYLIFLIFFFLYFFIYLRVMNFFVTRKIYNLFDIIDNLNVISFLNLVSIFIFIVLVLIFLSLFNFYIYFFAKFFYLKLHYFYIFTNKKCFFFLEVIKNINIFFLQLFDNNNYYLIFKFFLKEGFRLYLYLYIIYYFVVDDGNIHLNLLPYYSLYYFLYRIYDFIAFKFNYDFDVALSINYYPDLNFRIQKDQFDIQEYQQYLILGYSKYIFADCLYLDFPWKIQTHWLIVNTYKYTINYFPNDFHTRVLNCSSS